MKIQYGLFDSATGDTRAYSADQVAEVFRALGMSGVQNLDNCLKITASGSGMGINMAPGSALAAGYIMDAIDDGGGVYTMTLNSGGSNARIDRIVLRLDLSTDARNMLPAILQGTPSASPTAPALTRSGEIYELSLAQVYVAAGATSITDANITDERSNESVCGAIVPEVLKLSTLSKTHMHDAATTEKAGFMSTAQVTQLAAAVAYNTRIATLESKVASLESRLTALESTVSAHSTQLAGLTSTSTPTFKGANLTGSLTMNSNYIDGALFR